VYHNNLKELLIGLVFGNVPMIRAERSMKIIIPNQDILQYLLQNYYENTSGPRDYDYISSHWKYFSELIKLHMDDQGNLASLSGAAEGIETYMRRGFIDKFLDCSCVFSHFIHLPHRRELLKLYMIATKTCRRIQLDPPTFDVF